MSVFHKKVHLETNKQFEIVDITAPVKAALKESGLKHGMLLVYCPHTTSAIRINRHEPLLMQDILKMMYRLVPVDVNYAHDIFEIRENISFGERSNGHSHVKAFLLGSSETIPVNAGELMLGDRQSIFYIELDGGRKRDYYIQVVGE